MPLKLLPAEPGDLPRIVELENESFADSPLTPILFPNGKSQGSQSAYIETLLLQWQDNSASRHVKVIDTDLNDKIIAFARWFIFVGDDVKFIKTDPNERHHAPGSNEEAVNEFFGGLLKIRIRILGRTPHCCEFAEQMLVALLIGHLTVLSALCTSPQHQRRGAGTMLTKWGCDIAQKYGVPAYLEASPAGLPLYKKAGFQEVDKFVFDLEKYGVVGSRTNVSMIKHPENTPDMVKHAHPK
jgi:ribosomal protein S18 acetylase RimI-like enzyme